jgi:transposase
MERLPEMTSKVTTLVRAAGMEDPVRVANDATQRPDPEVPERARRRTFTAKYKLEVLAAYDAAPDGEKGAVLRREGLYSSHITQWRKARDVGALAGLAAPRGRKRRDAQAQQIADLQAESSDWSRSWPRPASWWMSRQNCTRSWRRCPGARISIRGRRRD